MESPIEDAADTVHLPGPETAVSSPVPTNQDSPRDYTKAPDERDVAVAIDELVLATTDTEPTSEKLAASEPEVAATLEPRKQAWIHVRHAIAPVPNIFDFIPDSDLLPAEVTDPTVPSRPATAIVTPDVPPVELPPLDPGNDLLLSLRIAPPDELQVLQVSESVQAEKTYYPPSDWPPLGWRDIYQLGLYLSYQVMLLRRDISPRFLVLDENDAVKAPAFRPLSSTAITVLASAGLAFNQTTEELVIRQLLPPPPDSKKKTKKKPAKKKTASRKYLVVRPVLPSPTKALAGKLPALPYRHRISKPRQTLATAPSDPNRVGSLGAIALFRALRVNTSLRSLVLEHAGVTDVAMGALAATLRVNASLTSLSLRHNRITHVGVHALCEALEDCADSTLLHLDLSHNAITDAGVPALCHALEENETLMSLDVAWNRLSSKALLALLYFLRGNFVLRSLSIHGKDIDEDQYCLNLESKYAARIADALRHANTSLATVALSSDKAKLPVDKLKSSRWLSLPGRSLVELDALVIAGLLPLNRHLLSLDLSGNRGIERWAILEVLKGIKLCPTLRHVNLADTGLFDEVGEQVGELVAANATLETIVMHTEPLHVQQLRGQDAVAVLAFDVPASHHFDRWILAKCLALNRPTQELNTLRLPPPAASSLGGAVKSVAINYSLRRLDVYEVVFLARKIFYHLHIGRVALNGCGIDSVGGVALADGVRNHASLQVLELENNALSVAGGRALTECIRYNQSLTYLNLSWNQIGDDGVAGIGDALQANKSITRLDLRGNQLRAVGIRAIAKGLARNACLQELYLRWNTVCPVGGEALAQALTQNKTLRLLDVEHHTMGERGAMAFADMLAVNTRLKTLNMKGDDAVSDGDAPGVGSDAAIAIANVLADKNRTVTHLNFGQNQIGLEGVRAFSDVVKFTVTLRELDLSLSAMDGKVADRFFECLSMNRSIVKLNLARNRISNEGMMACLRMTESNRTLEELNLAHNAITEEPLALLASKWQRRKNQATAAGMGKLSPLRWLCLTGNTMTEGTRRALVALAPTLTVELEEEVHQVPGAR